MLTVLAVALTILTGVIYWAASHVHQGDYWADRICANAQGLCDAQWVLLVATGAVILLALVRQLFKA